MFRQLYQARREVRDFFRAMVNCRIVNSLALTQRVVQIPLVHLLPKKKRLLNFLSWNLWSSRCTTSIGKRIQDVKQYHTAFRRYES